MNQVVTRTKAAAIPTRGTLGQLLEQLGGISPDRIHLQPPPGTATVEDVVAKDVHEDRLCELVEGVLVEKAGMGFYESILAVFLASKLHDFAARRNLGLVSGEQGMMQIFPGLVRIPDVAFASWQRFPDGKVPRDPVPLLVPDLAVEVLSRGETWGEMKRKLQDYFNAGVRLVWLVDPRKRTVTVYSLPDEAKLLSEGDTLHGSDVLPGFKLPLKKLFAELDRQASPSTARKTKRKKS